MSDDSSATLANAARRVAQRLLAQNRKLAVAESCTGGWLSKVLTDIAGSSEWFDRGFVTYSNDAKMDMLGVNDRIIETEGAVSRLVVEEMAIGALFNSNAQVSLAISGIAGPGGGTADKPVGTVWFAWGLHNEVPLTRLQHFPGERNTVRSAAVLFALQQLELLLD
ncbi:MAG: nicotinamide-nucleotide amidohydrolase family protein [gamma proteobacterium symbiont of Bathyaustriella thionipta]|nr:nicotinamide-nucleotide amidohydrolase family protein [gamma proteobacterium symbiont of Bathyaustriella thionipta]